jgi:Acyltransferase
MTETARHAPAPETATHPAPEYPRSPESKAHAYAREHGVSGTLYAVTRSLANVSLRSWFRVQISGREHIPADGPAIITPNHKSSLDAFFIGIATHRHVRYMAKASCSRARWRGCSRAWEHSRFAAAKPTRKRSRPRERSSGRAA